MRQTKLLKEKANLIKTQLKNKGISQLHSKVVEFESHTKDLEVAIDEKIKNFHETNDVSKLKSFLNKLLVLLDEHEDFIKGNPDYYLDKDVPLHPLVDDGKLDNFLMSEIDLLSDENFGVFMHFIKLNEFNHVDEVISRVNEMAGIIDVSRAVYLNDNRELPKLNLTSQINETKELIHKLEQEAIDKCNVKVGVIDFKKLKRAIDDKFDEEWSNLNLNEVTLDTLNKLDENYMNAQDLVEDYDPSKKDWNNMWFINNAIVDVFNWIDKCPLDFVEKPMKLSDVELRGFLETEEEPIDVIEFISNIEKCRIYCVFRLGCYMTYKSQI